MSFSFFLFTSFFFLFYFYFGSVWNLMSRELKTFLFICLFSLLRLLSDYWAQVCWTLARNPLLLLCSTQQACTRLGQQRYCDEAPRSSKTSGPRLRWDGGVACDAGEEWGRSGRQWLFWLIQSNRTEWRVSELVWWYSILYRGWWSGSFGDGCHVDELMLDPTGSWSLQVSQSVWRNLNGGLFDQVRSSSGYCNSVAICMKLEDCNE